MKAVRSIRPVNEWLRLRDSSGKYTINYKYWHRDKQGKSHYCDEFESVVGNIAELEKIFRALDIKPVVTVYKTRKIWLFKDFEIAIDSIKDLGDFVEIEYKGKDRGQKPAEITRDMVAFLKGLECGKITRNYVGYPFQLLFPKEIKTDEY